MLPLSVGDDSAQQQGEDGHEVEVPLWAQKLVQVHLRDYFLQLTEKNTHKHDSFISKQQAGQLQPDVWGGSTHIKILQVLQGVNQTQLAQSQKNWDLGIWTGFRSHVVEPLG